MGWMSDELSSSCGVFQTLRLDRTVIREALKLHRHSRIAQVTLCSILCATRFKFFSKEGLCPTVCGLCGQTDSFQHLLRCTQMGKIPTAPDALAAYLAEMAVRACAANTNPNLPVPVRGGEDQELDLGATVTSDTERGDAEALGGMDMEFENDDDEAFNVVELLRLADSHEMAG